MTDEVVKVYTETNEHKGAQLIFSDLGTPKNKNNQSEMLKDYMEDELGVPQDTFSRNIRELEIEETDQ
jgi:arginine repressor